MYEEVYKASFKCMHLTIRYAQCTHKSYVYIHHIYQLALSYKPVRTHPSGAVIQVTIIKVQNSF